MGILLCEQNFRDVWIRNKSMRAEIGQILRTHTHTTAAKLVVRIRAWVYQSCWLNSVTNKMFIRQQTCGWIRCALLRFFLYKLICWLGRKKAKCFKIQLLCHFYCESVPTFPKTAIPQIKLCFKQTRYCLHFTSMVNHCRPMDICNLT